MNPTYVAIIGILATLLLAVLGNIVVVCYWAGKMETKVNDLHEFFKETITLIRKEIFDAETLIKVEVNKREDAVKAIWQRIDELRDLIAKKENHLNK